MRYKILVVDDEPDILRVVIFRLKKLGYEVLTASDGKEGLDLIKSKRPDLVLLDFRLPTIDGLEITRRVKADDELKNIPIILLTASSTVEISKKAEEANADDCITKPFEPEELLAKVKSFLEDR